MFVIWCISLDQPKHVAAMLGHFAIGLNGLLEPKEHAW